ncbi:MAG: hypothetical protein PHV78_02845 [Patescibacteria group bacterium]|nr:hypothetical protein [Patescibacteria group bacterium]MDD5121677.1 hypothetical protein [Patescibacteria group bacterium]MDD5222078.1 hypothetical protein [Patescibacteria group bacterium]MDD5396159.1 hypothetical protein [Patescibacteria group bacterium]
MLDHKENIHGYLVYYDDEAKLGIEHLAHVLSFDEARSMFLAAHRTLDKIDFEDRLGRNFVLIGRMDGNFELYARKEGWF